MFAAAENKHENKSYPFVSHYDFFFIAILPNLKELFNVMFAKRIKSLKVQRLLYTVPFKGKLTVPRNLILETRFSILENFEDRGLSQVSRCSRPFENLARLFEDLSSRVLRLSNGKNKGIFSAINFWHGWILWKAYFSFTNRSILSSGPWYFSPNLFIRKFVTELFSL